jgi:energy-coupling factor transporter ATP-binding protein EcfA2
MPIDSLAITAGTWAWDKYGKTLTDKAVGGVKGHWDKFRWNEAAEKYRAKIKKLYGTMQIMGMAKPIPLDHIFTDAYMLDKPTAFSRFDIEYLKQASADPDALSQHAGRVNGLRLTTEKEKTTVEENGKELTIEKDRNLFILGKPGAGKTTFLKYIAVKAAEQLIDKVPIFISLKQWADSGSELMSFIVERFDICDFPEAEPFVKALLKSGGAIVLFDGLDEVNQESGQRDRQTRAMNDFIEKYDQTQCLITCRIAASDYSFKPFTYVEVADFTEKQIEIFVGNWFRNNEGEKDRETCARFLAEFKKEENKGLRDLARTPLLLTLLCLAFNETLTFPQRRVEIYEEALDALLKKWDSSRRIKRDEVYRKLSVGHKENMLARIAAETFENNEYFIQQTKLERLISDYVRSVPPHDEQDATDGEVILKAIEVQHGIFVERAREIYSFSHLTFQEYFTAKYIVANAAGGTLKNLVNAHCVDERWREVFLLTTSLLPDAGQFMKAFRRGVDNLLGGDKELRELLAWVSRKVESTSTSPWLSGLSCLYIKLYFGTKSNELRRIFDLIPHQNPELDQAVRYTLDIASTRHDLLSKTGARSLELSLDLNLSLILDIVCTRSRVRSSSLSLARARALARDLELEELEEELEDLWTPTANATVSVWRECEDRLKELMIKHRDDWRWWELVTAQEVRLADYINAANLLRDCLELAFMPPDEKKAMLSSLFSPMPPVADGRNV